MVGGCLICNIVCLGIGIFDKVLGVFGLLR